MENGGSRMGAQTIPAQQGHTEISENIEMAKEMAENGVYHHKTPEEKDCQEKNGNKVKT